MRETPNGQIEGPLWLISYVLCILHGNKKITLFLIFSSSSFLQRPNQIVAIKAITKKNLAKSQNLLGKEIKILKVRIQRGQKSHLYVVVICFGYGVFLQWTGICNVIFFFNYNQYWTFSMSRFFFLFMYQEPVNIFQSFDSRKLELLYFIFLDLIALLV